MRIVLVSAAGFLLAGCGGAGGGRQVIAAFYPLAFAAQTIGGPPLHVRNLTPAGAEPHDIELTPRDVAAVQRASVVLYLSHGFQPALEHAVREYPEFPVEPSPAMVSAYFFSALGTLPRASRSGVWGDPSQSSAERGREYLDQIEEACVRFVENVEATFRAFPEDTK